MSNGRKGQSGTKLTLAQAQERYLAKRRLEEQIGQGFVGGVKPEIKALLHWCILDKQAQIRSISFRRSSMHFEIDWPFQLPEPTGDPNTWFASRRSVREFAEAIRLYFLEQRCGAKLANLFRSEFEQLLPTFFRAGRFETFPVRKKFVRDVLQAAGRGMRRGVLAGRRMGVIPYKRAKQMRREGCGIIRVLMRMRKTHLMSVEEITKLTEKALLKQLASEYDIDRYPWVRYLRRSFGLLRPTKAWKHGRRPLLAAPASWATKELAVQILHQKYFHEAAAHYPLGAISKIVKCGTHSRK